MKEKRIKKTLPQYCDLKEPPSNIKSFYLSKNLTNKDFRMKFFLYDFGWSQKYQFSLCASYIHNNESSNHEILKSQFL